MAVADNQRKSLSSNDDGVFGRHTLTLAANEFIRRFLQHVLPSGVHKVRYYGLWAPSHRRFLHQVQMLLAENQPQPTSQEPSIPPAKSSSSSLEGTLCPHCAKAKLVCIGRLARGARSPP